MSDVPMDNGTASPLPNASAVYFNGLSNRRHAVSLAFKDRLEIREDERTLAAWSYADIRRADSPSGILRVTCLAAPALARLEVRDAATATELISRCIQMD